jgi:hypothetical protein
MNGKYRTWIAPIGLVAGLGLSACHGTEPGVNVPAPAPYVTVSESTTVVDPSIYQPAAWLTLRELPDPDLTWRLVRTTNDKIKIEFRPMTTTCEPPSSFDPGRAPVATNILSDVFWGAPQTGAGGRAGQPLATETQYFYPSVADSSVAFATLVQTFDDCVKQAGASPDPGTIPLAGASGAVVHQVYRTVDGASAGAWVHIVRFADGTAPLNYGGDNTYMEHPDSHYAIVRRANVLDVLELSGTSAVDASSGDAALVTAMATNLATYDQPPAPANLPTANATEIWQAWPPLQSLPAPPGFTWSGDVAGGIGISVDPATGGPVGNLACTQISATTPKDPALRLDEVRGYVARTFPPRPGLIGTATILGFTDPAAATTVYSQLVANMSTCAARLRVLQAQAKRPVDATVTLLYQGPASAVWTLTATGYSAEFAGIFPPELAPDRETHHVMILVRGPFVEAIDLAGSGQSPYTLTTDRAVIAAANNALCNFENVC